MPQVRLLSEQVCNQIAAGEVIERPASVVKELVENALDAQSDRLVVEIANGGRTLIRVSDNGVGMSRDDALMSLERHATSKLRSAEDLAHIVTMGFRGEAIPSIASVSRMSIITRPCDNEEDEGTEIDINGGKVIDVKAAGTPPGTSIEVRNLFYNLPARRKFLRSAETEKGHIQHYLTLVAIAYPKVALTYIQDGRTVFQLPAAASNASEEKLDLAFLRERLRLLYGDNDDDLIAVQREIRYDATPDEDEANGVPAQLLPLKLWGVIGTPGVSRSLRDRQHIFVNRRPVENKAISFALSDAYQSALMKGRYPVCCLFFEIDPSEVDVNVHPAKREVKFHKEMTVRRIVGRFLRETLEEYSHPKVETPDLPQLENVSVQAEKDSDLSMSERHLLTPDIVSAEKPPHGEKKPSSQVASVAQATHDPLPSTVSKKVPVYPVESSLLLSVPPRPSFNNEPPDNLSPARMYTPAPLLSLSLKYIGVLHQLYVLFESDRGLVILDQHAAHERVLYERLMAQAKAGNADSQRLLLSDTVELGVRDANTLRSKLDQFTALGIGIHEFGERTFLVDALPPFVKNVGAKEFILQLLDDLRSTGRELMQADLAEDAIAAHACRLAVKANDDLNEQEILKLLDDLRHCKMPYTCPHGRPTIIEFSSRDLEKKFRRIV